MPLPNTAPIGSIEYVRTHVFGMTQHEFANLLGVKQATVCRWEAGNPPPIPQLRKIRDLSRARGFRPTFEMLLGEPT